MRVAQYVEQPLITKLFMFAILSLVQAIGLDKQCTAFDTFNFLAFKLQSRQHSYGEVRFHLEEVTMVSSATNDRWVMAGVAERQMARLQIKHTDEECDEHIGRILVAGQCFVHMRANVGRCQLLIG